MPKLLQIDSCLGILSTGRITESIAALATVKGWDCYIAHGARCIGETRQTHYQITKKFDEYVHYAQSLLFDSHGLHSTAATRRLVKWIDSIKPDVINLHCIHGYHLNYKVLFEYLNAHDIPVVWTFHDCWAFTGHCGHFVSAECNKWKKECHDCALKGEYPKSIGFDRSRENFRLKKELFLSVPNMTIVPVSYWLNDVVKQSFFKNVPSRVIYNGVDTEVFQNRKSNLRHELGLEGKVVLLGVASAWSETKGLSDYIMLSKTLSERYKIVLIGVSDKLSKQLPSNIVCIGRTSNSIQLAEYYSMADIVMNLSYAETFGLTTAEGMACGTPGIVYNRTASPELVTPETGFIVEAGDFNALENAIYQIGEKGKEHYSSACRERAMEYFEKNKRFSEYVDLYEKLLNKNN